MSNSPDNILEGKFYSHKLISFQDNLFESFFQLSY